MAQLRTREELHFAAYDTRVIVKRTLLSTMLVVAAFFCFPVYQFYSQVHTFNDARQYRIEMNHTLSANHSPSYLRSEAVQILHLNAEGLFDPIDKGANGSLKSADIVQAIKHVAKTGTALRLNTQATSGLNIFNVLKLYLAIVILLCGTLSFFRYFVHCVINGGVNGSYLLDLPWKQNFGTVLFIFSLTLLPIGFPFYIVSGIRTIRARRRSPPVDETVVEPTEQPPITVEDTSLAARQLYCDLRAELWHSRYERRVKDLKQRYDKAMSDLQTYGTIIRAKQINRNTIAAELRALQACNFEDQAVPDLEHLSAEFDRLMALPGIIAVRVDYDRLILILNARIDWEGKRYDLGDWKLVIDADSGFTTTELRSGVREGWCGGSPVYRLGREFCFGQRESTIKDNFLKGQLLEAIELAVDCIQSINEEDTKYIHNAFYEENESRKDREEVRLISAQHPIYYGTTRVTARMLVEASLQAAAQNHRQQNHGHYHGQYYES